MFYKFENSILINNTDTVIGPTYLLISSEKDTYTYPIDGWYWFDDDNQARTFFGLPLIVPTE